MSADAYLDRATRTALGRPVFQLATQHVPGSVDTLRQNGGYIRATDAKTSDRPQHREK